MARIVQYSARARYGLYEIVQYIEDNFGPEIAYKQYHFLVDQFAKLALNPEIGRQESAIHPLCWSYLAHQNARVYYRFDDTELTLELIWNPHRDPTELQQLLATVFEPIT